jgi:hypothetical protein
MAVSKFRLQDWRLGWLVKQGNGVVAIPAVTLVDSTGAVLGTSGAPLPVTVITEASGALTKVEGVDGATIATATNPFPIEITDGTNGIAAVKAASTAPVAVDKAVVVAISPNGQLSAGQALMAASVPTVPASDYYPTAATYKNIAAGQATTVVKASAGVLYSITFNGPATATNTTTVYDNASTSGTVIAIPLATAVVSPTTITFGPNGVAFALGLTIITATANGANMTVAYR